MDNGGISNRRLAFLSSLLILRDGIAAVLLEWPRRREVPRIPRAPAPAALRSGSALSLADSFARRKRRSLTANEAYCLGASIISWPRPQHGRGGGGVESHAS